MDGQELSRRIASRWPRMPILFITGYADLIPSDGLPGPVLMKPYSPDTLAVAVRKLLLGPAPA